MVTLLSLVISFTVIGEVNIKAEAKNQFETQVVSNQTTSVQKDYGKMSLLFEENKGQTEKAAKFVSRGKGYTLYMAETEAVFQLQIAESGLRNEEPATKNQITKTKSDILKMRFVGANANPTISGDSEAVTKTNYYIGKKRFENVSNFQKVNYKNLYNGIDAVFYGNQSNQLEYDFTVAPNADADQIGLNFDGAEDLSIDENGNLIVKTAHTELVQQKPVAYQEINGERNEVASRYVISENTVKFELGDFDKSKTLTIDPALSYLTYIGGTAFDNVRELAVDASGNAYITGQVNSLTFHGQSRNSNDGSGAYVAKINADGTAFLYVTILEGNGDDAGFGVAVDASGNAYATGQASHFFPATSGAFDTVHGVVNGADAFVTKLNTTGGIVYSSFLGGTDFDEGNDIAVDASGKAYVVGDTYSNSAFPTKNRYQGCGVVSPLQSIDSLDAFLTVFNASGSDITYSSCIGNTIGIIGSSDESAISVAVDSTGNAYLTGETNSNNFKVKNAAQPNIGGGKDAFVAKFIPTQSGDASVSYATFLGGSGTDRGFGIAVDSSNQAHVTGLTGSFNFPLLNAFDSTNQINEAFVTKYNSSGGLSFSSFLGGADQDEGDNIALDSSGSIYVGGSTLSNDFPMALPFQNARRGLRDAFFAKIRIGTGVVSSSYLGGNGNDKAFGIAVRGRNIFIGGPTESSNLLTTSGVIKPTSNANATNSDGFVAKVLDTHLDSVGVFRPASTFILTQSTTNVVAQNATLTGNIAGAKGVSGDFNGDGVDTVGSFSDGAWKVRDTNFPILILPPRTFNFGLAGDLPVVGDWDGDGVDTAGTYRPSTGQFFLTNTANAAAVNFTIQFGIAEDLPVAGDWDGDGIDTIGVFRPSAGQFFLTNSNVPNPNIDLVAFFGTTGDLPVGGDFDGSGTDTIGVWRPSTAQFFLSNDNINIANVFNFGAINTDQPIVGDWDGKPNP